MLALIEKVGARVYAINTPFAAKDQLKGIGCHWDGEKRAWWIGTSKASELAKVIESINTPSSTSSNPSTAKKDPHEIRLTGKGRYKGREYYAGSITRDGLKVRLLTLPDAAGEFLDFWASCSEVEQTKTYAPREVWDGRRYSGKTVTKYTTLGSIADFIAQQKRDAGTGRERVQCHECDAWHDANESCRECGGC